MRSYLPFVLLTVLANTPAQDCAYVPNKNASAGACYVIPFGSRSTSDPKWSNQKYQTLVKASALPAKKFQIRALGFAACTAGQRRFASIRIRMQQTPRPALSVVFAENLDDKKAVTVLELREHVWNTPADSWARIGLQRSFPFDPALGNLVVEIEVRGAGAPGLVGSAGFRDSNLPRIHAAGWAKEPPAKGKASQQTGLRMALCYGGAMIDVFGRSCPGPTSTARLDYASLPRVSKTLNLILEGASAKTKFALLTFGATNQAPFPVDLEPLGAKGCMLYHSFELVIGTAVKNGSTTVPVPIPNAASLIGRRLYSQFIVEDPQANLLRLTTTNYARWLIGS